MEPTAGVAPAFPTYEVGGLLLSDAGAIMFPMASGIPVIDIFGVLSRRRPRRPIWRVLQIMAGKVPQIPGESPWGFPVFRPTAGPTEGPASAGMAPTPRGIPQGSARRMPIGVVFGPPTDPP